ncbi:hypothetical protein CBOM_07512 [Ceraceosorus bombacis]|uniref:Uncharacterized protein n=1 Tax=Ceraceosorus bombacis TaxID=401625 RepID=A0A0P1BEC9_9BASI|nr:hypothetical protein CBOM_07512 [Ceraceosorus bombacis]
MALKCDTIISATPLDNRLDPTQHPLATTVEQLRRRSVWLCPCVYLVVTVTSMCLRALNASRDMRHCHHTESCHPDTLGGGILMIARVPLRSSCTVHWGRLC